MGRIISAIFKSIALIFALGLLGALGGCVWQNFATSNIPSGTWQAWDLGQDRAVQFLSAVDQTLPGQGEWVTWNVLQVSVRTQSGAVYSCSTDAMGSNACRQAQAQENASASTPSCGKMIYVAPAPPGEVLDSIAFHRCSAPCGDIRVIILRDGSLWMWRNDACNWAGFSNINAGFYGFVLGMLAGVVLLIGRWSWRRRTTARLKAPA